MNERMGKGLSFLLFLVIVFFPRLCLGIEVTDAVICQNVQVREPVNAGSSFTPDVGRVWCWSKIQGGEGTIKHIYYYNGKEQAVVELGVQPGNFRTYSSKRIMPSQMGPWRVDIVDTAGTTLRSLDFVVQEAAAPATTEPEQTEQQPSQ